MKKNHLFLILLVGCMAMVGKTNAQTTKNISSLVDAKSLEKTLYLFDLGAINDKAVRNFKQTYPNVDGEKWHSFKDGFAATFNEGSIQHMVTYNRKGNQLYSIANYHETGLPREIRGMIKSVYYDYTISFVQEITFQQQAIYLVHVQDEFSWKTVRVADGEMTVIEDFIKG